MKLSSSTALFPLLFTVVSCLVTEANNDIHTIRGGVKDKEEANNLFNERERNLKSPVAVTIETSRGEGGALLVPSFAMESSTLTRHKQLLMVVKFWRPRWRLPPVLRFFQVWKGR